MTHSAQPAILPIDANPGLSMRAQALPPSAWHGHIPFAGWLVGALRPARIVELGTHHGASYLAFCQAVRALALPTRCFAVDTWAGDPHAGFYGDEVLDALRQLHDPHYAGFSTLLRMTFDEALGEIEDGSVDLLHIDGLHTYEAARHDFESWLPKLSSRAVVLFHDIAERGRDFGVWRLWEELSARHPAFDFAHAHGLGVLLVGADMPPPVARLATMAAPEAARTRDLFAALGEGVEARAQAQDLTARLAGAEQGIDEYRGQAQALERDRDRLQAEVAGLRDGMAMLRDEFAANRARIEGMEHHAAGLVAGVDAYRVQAEALERDRARLQGELQGMATGVAALQAELAASRADARDAWGKVAEGNAQAQDLAQRLAEANARHEDAQRRLADASTAHAVEIASARDAIMRASEAHQVEVAALQARADALAAEVAAMLGSRSWRSTAWLRALGRILRGRG